MNRRNIQQPTNNPSVVKHSFMDFVVSFVELWSKAYEATRSINIFSNNINWVQRFGRGKKLKVSTHKIYWNSCILCTIDDADIVLQYKRRYVYSQSYDGVLAALLLLADIFSTLFRLPQKQVKNNYTYKTNKNISYIIRREWKLQTFPVMCQNKKVIICFWNRK